jgi:membrane protease YdiL (CAAX protease family)
MRNFNFIQSKWMIITELLVALFLIFGYNMFQILPISETPFLVLLAFISIKIHKTGWGSLGLRKPDNWKRTILISLVAAIAMQLSGSITDPLIAKLTGSTPDLSSFEDIKGNLSLLLIYLALIWTLAAFGEEISYRGLVLTKISQLLGSTKLAWVTGIIITGFLFGVAHYYKGLAGMVDSGLSGLIYGSLFVLTGRNLWISILTHGFADTYGLFYIYFGLHHN